MCSMEDSFQFFFCPVCSNCLHLVTSSDSVFNNGRIVDD